MKVLIVDDEPIIREVIREFFELESIEVKEAKNGREAFELIVKDGFDCVISDVRMPNGDGVELAKNLHAMTGKKPIIIFITGYTDISESGAKELGVATIVFKPFLPQQLIKVVKDAVAGIT